MSSRTIGIGLLILAATLTASGGSAATPRRHPPNPGAVTIAAKVSGVPLRMLVDTGTQRSCLDTGVIAKLGMKSGAIAAVMTPYANASTRELPVRTLEIASFHVEDVAMLVIDMSAISAASGFRLDGILGTDILKLLPIQLDFSENLAQPVLLPEASAVSAVVELHEADGLFYRATVIQGVPVRLLLDTGSNLSNISSAAWQRVTAAWSREAWSVASDPAAFVLTSSTTRKASAPASPQNTPKIPSTSATTLAVLFRFAPRSASTTPGTGPTTTTEAGTVSSLQGWISFTTSE